MLNVKFEAMELREKIKEILIKHYHFVDCDDVADELLNLHSVSQQRELLIDFSKYIFDTSFDEEIDIKDVDDYLKSINCG